MSRRPSTRPSSPNDSASSPPRTKSSKSADMTPTSKVVIVKPTMRGKTHHYGAYAAAAAGASLVASASNISGAKAGWACLIYTVSLVCLFATSATYHIPSWSERARLALKRLDHSMIFVHIAATYAPLCLLAPLPPGVGAGLLTRVAAGAGLGVAQSLLWPRAPRPVAVALYIALGWMAVPDARALTSSLPALASSLILAGGVCYTMGAICYAAKYPDPAPSTFGYHEIFHAATIAASIAHFAAVHIVAHATN